MSPFICHLDSSLPSVLLWWRPLCRKILEVHGAPTAQAQAWVNIPRPAEAETKAPVSSAHVLKNLICLN